ncbi:alpha/beta hydrolase [Paraburkholderia sp.]|uniref:alpha/beta fold hydrolase n=1 Tax=Paraburkholderia sp. TaxID=1926495 RepID=UPI00238C3143|nr:alpha/beta hydrolase [Paraburkholderia sp.]MDE1183831.1 alpha/beta hydrolase [Paraburkholderia sp.]
MSSAPTSLASSQFARLPENASRDALDIEYRFVECASGETSGDAPLIVFLHEGLGSIDMWRDWPRALCERLKMRGLVYARPGYGRSTPRPHHVRLPVEFMTSQADDVLPALLDVLQIDEAQRQRMWVVGHSDGGSIALLYAATFPEQLAGVVAIAPHVFVEDISVENIAAAKTAYEHGDLRARLARYHADVDSAFYGWNDIWLDPAFRHWRIAERLSTIRCPLLAVQGYDDNYGTMAQIDTIAEYVPHAQLTRLDRCGHSPHRDAPEALTDAIARFVLSSSTQRHA